jgi:hypothetical protein
LNQAESVEFLQRLTEEVPLERLSPDQAAIDRQLDALKKASDPSFEVRRQWVAALSPDEKADLQELNNRFNNAARDPKQTLRLATLERQIRTAEDAEKLQKAMVAYSNWLSNRGPGYQDDLLNLPADERIGVIQRSMRWEKERESRPLTAEDAMKLRNEIMVIFEERKGDFRREMRRRNSDNGARLEGPLALQAWMVVLWELRNDERDRRTTDRLVEQLSPEARQYWEGLSRRRGRQISRGDQLGRWIFEAMRPTWGPEELEQFFAKDLNNTERERLLRLPPDEMQRRLEHLYLASKFGIRDSEEWEGMFGPRGGFLPGPRGPGGPEGPGPGGSRGGPPPDIIRPGGPPPDEFRMDPPGERPDRRRERRSDDGREREPSAEKPTEAAENPPSSEAHPVSNE